MSDDAIMEAAANPALVRMQKDEVALGLIVHLGRSGEIARVAKVTDHDFLFIDMQHAIFSLETVNHIVQAANALNIAPLIRLPSVDDLNAATLLDVGAAGLVFPNVHTADDARRAVAKCKFSPLGRRSVQGTYSKFNYAKLPLPKITSFLNRHTLIVCMIESREGLENVDAIAAVEGVDVLHVGANDLLFDLGAPRAYGGPEITDAMNRILAAGKKHGKYVGFGGDKDPARQAALVKQGVRFITTNGDLHLLIEEFGRRNGELRKLFSAS
ncbi:MAG TPA: aldolase/citrate lyase family protein [Bauldia sp.]|nr:aldolase/citrate lyase family protein [Bauldia sp.]